MPVNLKINQCIIHKKVPAAYKMSYAETLKTTKKKQKVNERVAVPTAQEEVVIHEILPSPQTKQIDELISANKVLSTTVIKLQETMSNMFKVMMNMMQSITQGQTENVPAKTCQESLQEAQALCSKIAEGLNGPATDRNTDVAPPPPPEQKTQTDLIENDSHMKTVVLHVKTDDDYYTVVGKNGKNKKKKTTNGNALVNLSQHK